MNEVTPSQLESATQAQKDSFESLLSSIEIDEASTLGQDIVFSGYDVDGPVVGYINPEGKVTWA